MPGDLLVKRREDRLDELLGELRGSRLGESLVAAMMTLAVVFVGSTEG